MIGFGNAVMAALPFDCAGVADRADAAARPVALEGVPEWVWEAFERLAPNPHRCGHGRPGPVCWQGSKIVQNPNHSPGGEAVDVQPIDPFLGLEFSMDRRNQEPVRVARPGAFQLAPEPF